MNVKLICLRLPVLLLILPVGAAEAPLPKFKAVEIDAHIKIGYGLALADVDGDKKIDILLVDKDEVAWYENPSWKKHVMAEHLTPRDHVCIAARDINGDGKAEVAVGAEWNPGDTVNSGAVFYLLPPADRTQKWEPIRLSHEPTTHRMHWVKAWPEGYRLVVLPLHGRGNRGGQGEGVKILSYLMPPNPHDPWTTRLLNDSLHMTHNFDPVNWDEDRAEELLIASKEGTFLLNWAESGFKLEAIGGNEGGGAGEVRLGKLPGGRRCVGTIEPMHGTRFVTYTPPASDSNAFPWTRNVVDESLVDGHALAAGDILGVGSDQFVVGWRAMNRSPSVKVGIKLFTPLDPEGSRWRSTLIDDNTMACEDLKLADLDGDGRLDIVAAGRATKNVKVYFNEGGD
jgi:FG-GAP-like repeat